MEVAVREPALGTVKIVCRVCGWVWPFWSIDLPFPGDLDARNNLKS